MDPKIISVVSLAKTGVRPVDETLGIPLCGVAGLIRIVVDGPGFQESALARQGEAEARVQPLVVPKRKLEIKLIFFPVLIKKEESFLFTLEVSSNSLKL